MTTKKPREFWVDDIFNVDRPYTKTAYIHFQDADDKGHFIIHVREVLPEPTDGEIEKMFWVHENKNGVPHTKRDDPAWMYSQKDFEAGFRAALEWMRGER